jgi:ferredoxin
MSDLPEMKISGLLIKIDKGTCIGTGNCIKVAPEIFEFDNEKIVSFKNEISDIEQDRLTEACSVCPVNALFTISEEGKQIVP